MTFRELNESCRSYLNGDQSWIVEALIEALHIEMSANTTNHDRAQSLLDSLIAERDRRE